MRLDPSDATLISAQVVQAVNESMPTFVEPIIEEYLRRNVAGAIRWALDDVSEDAVGAAVRDAIQREINSYKITVTFESRLVDGADRSD